MLWLRGLARACCLVCTYMASNDISNGLKTGEQAGGLLLPASLCDNPFAHAWTYQKNIQINACSTFSNSRSSSPAHIPSATPPESASPPLLTMVHKLFALSALAATTAYALPEVTVKQLPAGCSSYPSYNAATGETDGFLVQVVDSDNPAIEGFYDTSDYSVGIGAQGRPYMRWGYVSQLEPKTFPSLLSPLSITYLELNSHEKKKKRTKQWKKY